MMTPTLDTTLVLTVLTHPFHVLVMAIAGFAAAREALRAAVRHDAEHGVSDPIDAAHARPEVRTAA